MFDIFLGALDPFFVGDRNQLMKLKTTFFFLFLISTSLTSQVKITGKVTDSLSVVANAHIVNLTTKNGTITNDSGSFEIMVKIGDELEITSIQHETIIATVANITLRTKQINIELKIKTYELEAFDLKKTDLIGSLSIDLKDVPVDRNPKIDAITLNLPFTGMKKLSPIDRKIRTATTASGGLPLDLILNILSGRLKKLKEEKRVIEENFDVAYMHKNYKFFIMDYYEIQKDDLYRFLHFCVEDPSYRRFMLKDEFKMIKFLKFMSEKFNALRRTND